MPPKKQREEQKVYQLKVTLLDIEPPIWRRILVPHNIRLDKLHSVLQVVMGWTDSHLHEFTIDGVSYGDPSIEMDMVEEAEDETKFRLHKVVPREEGKFHYLYDFGDSWEHEILVEKILPLGKGTRYPVCLAGKRACPPEDCGGAPGYENLLESLKDPSHPEHENMFDWLPGDFDSEKFDIEAVNRRLAGSRP